VLPPSLASSDGGVIGGEISCSLPLTRTGSEVEFKSGIEGGAFIAMTLDAIEAFCIAFSIDTAYPPDTSVPSPTCIQEGVIC
jgi:hypothetical protein